MDAMKPTPETEPDVSSLRCRTRWLRVGQIVLLILLVAYLLAFGWGYGMLRSEQAKIAEAGASLDVNSYLPSGVPREDNATSWLEVASLLYEAQAEEAKAGKEFRNLIFPLTPEQVERVRAVLASSELLLTHLDRARACSQASFADVHGTWSEVVAAGPNYRCRQALADLLRARTLLALSENDPDHAAQDIEDMFRLANWCATEHPSLIAGLMAIHIVCRACDLVQDMLRVGPPSAPLREPLVAAAVLARKGIDLPRYVAFERACTDRIWREGRFQVGDTGEGWFGSPTFRWLYRYPLRPVMLADRAAYLAMMRKGAERVMQPCYRLPPREQDDPLPWYAFLSVRLSPWSVPLAARRDRMIAAVDFLAIAMLLEDYRESKGSYPSTLAHLDVEPRIDPFTGERYRYSSNGTGYTLTSLAAPWFPPADDPQLAGLAAGNGDLVWHVP